MNWTKIIIDTIGTVFEIYLVILFYRTFLVSYKCRKITYAIGFLLYALYSLAFISIFQNQVLLPISFAIFAFLFSFYFKASLTSRLLLALTFTALIVVAETVVGIVLTRFTGIPIESQQNSFIPYFIGVTSSKLFALMLIYAARIFIIPKNQEFTSKWFNIVMSLLPLQSLLLCFVVQNLTVNSNDPHLELLCEIVMFISFMLLGITTFILNNQLKAMRYQQEHKETKNLLNIQLEHYNELSLVGQELKAMRHDLRNEHIALFGLLSENKVEEALKYIEDTDNRIRNTEAVVDTGLPAIDAIVNSKIKKAAESNIQIQYKMLMDSYLHIDQIDIALLLANALDNAIEAIMRSADVNTIINAVVASKGSFISIMVENQTSDVLDTELKTTKADKENHGYGIRQMKVLVEKYDGDLSVEHNKDNKTFLLNILLRNPKL